MKLKEVFVTEKLEDKYVMVSMDNDILSGIIRSNESAAFIVDCMRTETSKEEVIDKVLKHYDIDEVKARIGVEKVIGILQSINALE